MLIVLNIIKYSGKLPSCGKKSKYNIGDYSWSGRHKKSGQKQTVRREVLEQRSRERETEVCIYREKLDTVTSEMTPRRKQ